MEDMILTIDGMVTISGYHKKFIKMIKIKNNKKKSCDV